MRSEPSVIAGAAGQNQYAVNLFKNPVGLVTKQLGGDRLNILERIGDSTRLLKNFFLHVVAVRPKFCRAGVHVHSVDLAIDLLARCIHDPDIAQLQISNVTIFKVNNLVGGAGQRQSVRGQKIFVFSASDDQWRAITCRHDAVWFVTTKHSNRVGAL